MAKQDWGTKRLCQSCATKFYDFSRTPIVCPKCGTEFEPEALLKSRRSRPTAVSKPVKAVKPPKPAAEEDEDIVALDDADEEDDSVLEDTSDLEDDDVKVVVGAPESGEDETEG